MTNYSNLLLDQAYLIIENEGEEVSLIQVLMQTNKCVLVEIHDDEQTTFWRKKSDPIFEIIDQLTDAQVEAYDELFEEEDTDYSEEIDAEHQEIYL
ncbi:MAG TPA: hypothetical protein VK718_04600 [Ferruginibacter sp.]|jgi:hypothetical protein|nr:hypothetical protein [Ferruginibacter sp.]